MLFIKPTIHHLFFLILSFLLPLSSSSSSNLPPDAAALLSFKQKADPHNLLLFNTSLSHCKWRGVQCLGSKVVRLVIEDHNLAGVFPPESLTRLDQLRVLSLRNNSLAGELPDLSGLLNLKALFLHHNRFSGNFPPSISSLRRIRTIDFSHNNFSGELPTWLTRLDRLYYLRVEFNRFVGPIPALNQSTLLVFNVSNNNLSGPVPVTPVLSQFESDSYAHNPKLCGEIVHVECDSKRPFFRPTTLAPLPAPPPAAVAPVEDAQLRGVGVDITRPNPPNKHRRRAVILGFSLGVFLLIGSILCFAMAVRKQRKELAAEATMASDLSATAGAAAVMRAEEEREEKVKSAQMMKKVVERSGSLVFCAGEAQVYSLDQLMRASAELLGRGMIGTTYKAVLDNRLIVCVKRLDGSKMGSTGKMVFERHMESVGGLRHPNLVPLRAYFQAQEERLLVYDYQPNGSLFSLIHGSKSARTKPLHWTSCLKIAEDVAQGLSYIHQAWRLVHGNLKSTNVLLGSDFEACVTDYCLSVLTDPAPSSDMDLDSYGYKAPEIRKSDSPATPKSDVYAFGVLLLELLTGKAPSEHPFMTPTDIVQWVRSARDEDDGGRDESRLAMLLEVAIACSMASPEHRPNMWQVLKMLQEIKEAVLMEEEALDPCQGMV